jgi:two-component system response regulator DesR
VIRVLLVIQDALWCEALSFVLSTHQDIRVVSKLARVSEAITDTTSAQSDVGIINIDPKSDHSNLTALSKFNDSAPSCRVLALVDQTIAASIHKAWGDYVQGFLSRNTNLDSLITSVRKVAGGEKVVEPTLAVAALSASVNPLTSREYEVLQCLMRGMGNKDIAAHLHLAVGSVRNLTTSILNKFGAHTRIEAVAKAEKAGWL